MALKEVAIAAVDSQSGNTKAGDIVVIRNPRGEMGKKEQEAFLWLLIDESELPSQSEISKVALDPETGEPIVVNGQPVLNTQRAWFDIDELAAKANINAGEIRNPNRKYQPFTNPHPVNGRFQANVPTTGVAFRKGRP